MGDDFDRDDPHVGPDHLPGPDVGATFTFDFDGHPRSVDIDVPGTAEGSDPAHIDFGGDPASPPDPGWMPNLGDAGQVLDPFSLPPPEGWHRDPVTGVLSPDLSSAPPAAGDGSGSGNSAPGDYPTPDPNAATA